MRIELDHLIVPARDGERSARWFTELGGTDDPVRVGGFWQVRTTNHVDRPDGHQFESIGR